MAPWRKLAKKAADIKEIKQFQDKAHFSKKVLAGDLEILSRLILCFMAPFNIKNIIICKIKFKIIS